MGEQARRTVNSMARFRPRAEINDGGGPGTSDVFAVGLPTQALPVTPFVIALVGLALEARIAASPDVVVICHQRGQKSADTIEEAIRAGCRSMISFGIAGGLAPGLGPGDLIVASVVIDQQTIRPTDAAWSGRLLQTIPGSIYAPILGVDAAIANPTIKRHLHSLVGAVAVDMESHVVARLAGGYDLAFAALRVIIDPAHRAIPDAALAGIGVDGNTDLIGVLRQLMARPSQTIALARLALDLLRARSRLVRTRHLLDSGFLHAEQG
jgi:hopanoid-associated phosphorylase